MRPFKLTSLQLRSRVTLPNSEQFYVPWDTIVVDEVGAFDLAHPTRITVPQDFRGIMRMTASFVWPHNNVGHRQIFTRRNGSAENPIAYPFGYMSGSAPPNPADGGKNSLSYAMSGPWFRPDPGDYWEVGATQRSGAPMTTNIHNSLWVQVEWWPD